MMLFYDYVSYIKCTVYYVLLFVQSTELNGKLGLKMILLFITKFIIIKSKGKPILLLIETISFNVLCMA